MERNSRQIAVLLATYNGARFLREQLESLFRQTCEDFHLYVRDDGSTDSTLKILATFMQLHPGRITLVGDGEQHCGAAQSFMRLLQSVESDYYISLLKSLKIFHVQSSLWKRKLRMLQTAN